MSNVVSKIIQSLLKKYLELIKKDVYLKMVGGELAAPLTIGGPFYLGNWGVGVLGHHSVVLFTYIWVPPCGESCLHFLSFCA